MEKINQQGRSMVEMLGVLAIIGVLSIGGIAGYTKAMNKYKINKTTDQVTMMIANIRTLFSTQGDYTGITNKTAKKYGIVPNDMFTLATGEELDANDTIVNPFGGSVTIVSDKLRSDDSVNRAFIIEYNNITPEACITILTGDWGSGQGSGLLGITAGDTGADETPAAGTLSSIGKRLNGLYIGDTTVEKVAIPGGQIKTPVTVAQATAWCEGTGATNTVAWKYY